MKVANERSSLTKSAGKSKKAGRNAATKYGSTNDRKMVDTVTTKEKYRNFQFLKKLWKWKSSKKTPEELLEEGPNIEQKKVTLVTYAICFIMMMAGLSVKMD